MIKTYLHLTKDINCQAPHAPSAMIDYRYALPRYYWIMTRIIFILCSILYSSSFLIGQDYQTYEGHIIDAVDSSAAPFVHIFFAKYENRGAVSLNDGTFEVKTTSDDTLIISSMIFETKKIPVNTLLPVNNQIFLEAKSHELSNLTILSEDALYDILENVIKEIPNNYPSVDHQLSCYYQEYSIANEDYGHMLEAYLTIEDQGYIKENKIERTEDHYDIIYAPHKIKVQQLRRTDDNRHLLINQYREISDMTIDNILRVNSVYGKNLIPWSRNEAIDDLYEQLNSFRSGRKEGMNKIRLQGLGYHQQDRDTLIDLSLDWFYMKKSDEYLMTSTYTINLADYAVTRIKTQVSDYVKENWIKPKNSERANDFREVRYRKVSNTYVPFLIAIDRGFSFMGDTQSDFVSRKLIVQEVKFGPKKNFIKGGKKVQRGKRLSELKFDYDEEFWSNINIPTLANPLDAIKAELSRYKSIQEQYEDNQKIR